VGHELTLKWLSGQNEKLSGEVKRNCIHLYVEDEESALRTLKHEFLDYTIGKVIEPYEKIANTLIGLINEESYKRKEKLVEILCKLLE